MYFSEAGAKNPRLTHQLRGFTLVEIMVVVVIIGVLASIAIPAITKLKRNAQNSRFINDLRVFSAAFETHALQAGGWPADAQSGVVPTEMIGEIKASDWEATSSIGGRWDYDANVFGVVAGISITDVTVDDEQMKQIDAKIDDGNINTGNFRHVGNRFIWALEYP